MNGDEFVVNLRQSYADTSRLPDCPPELTARLRPLAALLRRHPPPAATGDYLLLIDEPEAPRWVALEPPCMVVGRSRDCDLRIDRPWVSARHCRFQEGDDGWTVRDLESKNGLWVNLARTTERRLCRGDVVQLGSVTLIYLRLSSAAGG